jgi:predicted DNA binding CopG/RHH family protein
MNKHNELDLELDDYEKELLEGLEKEGYKRSPDFEAQKKKLQEAARLTLEKTKNINIRISQGDLYTIRHKAEKQGIPYQTLISSLIHQYSNNQIDYNVLREPRVPYNVSPKPKTKKKSGK